MTPSFPSAPIDLNRSSRHRTIPSLRCAWRGVVAGLAMACCATWAAADETAIPFSASTSTVAGLERGVVEGGWRFTGREAVGAATEVSLGSFPAESNKAYTVECDLSGNGAGLPAVTVQTRWRGEGNKDEGEVDAVLGRGNPTLSTSSPQSWAGKAVRLHMEGKAAVSTVDKGELVLLLPKLGKGEDLEITKVHISEGIVQKPESKTAVIPGEVIREGDACLAKNLVGASAFGTGKGPSETEWTYQGDGSPHVEEGGYGGIGQCIRIDKDNAQGRWISPAEKLEPGTPVWVGLWTKFSATASFPGYPAPAAIEFLKEGAGGKLEVVRQDKPPEFRFDKSEMLTDLYGSWFPLYFGPIAIPTGATHARVVVQFHDVRKSWMDAPSVANALPMRFCNFMLWQAPDQKIPESWAAGPDSYQTMLASAKQTPPPFFPVAGQRENSIAVFTLRKANANVFFPEEGAKPKVKIAVANLLPVRQEAVLKGGILDSEGKQIKAITQKVSLAPYSVKEVAIQTGVPPKYGAYMIELKASVNGHPAGAGYSRFAWLRKPTTPDQVRHNDGYPFDMHPGYPGLTADGYTGVVDPIELNFEAGVLRRLGVRAVRLPSRYTYLDYRSSEASVEGARKKVEVCRTHVLPVLKKHGIDSWISLMEQGRGILPKTPEQLKIWRDYNLEQFKGFGKEPLFYIFGNEGLGGGMPDNLDVNLFKHTAGDASVREWMAAYQAAYSAAKEANPECLIGPSHAGDNLGKVSKAFHSVLGAEGKSDVWGYNAYSNPAVMGKNIHESLRSGGYDPKFGVLVEVGLNAPFSGESRAPMEQKQAAGMVQTYLTTLSNGWVKRISWFILHGGRGICTESFNIFDADWTPRPVAAAYLVLADTLRAGRVEKRITLSGGGEFFIWRRVDNSVVGVGWAPGEENITLDTGGVSEVEISDIYGNRKKCATAKGIICMTLKKDPVYLMGASNLSESKALECQISNVTETADGPDILAVKVRNNTATAQTIMITNQSHPTVIVTPSKSEFEIKPGKEVSSAFQINQLDGDDRRRAKIGFKISNSNLTFETKVTDTLARCVYAASTPSFDGTWKGWEQAKVLHADRKIQVEEPLDGRWHGPADLSAVIRTMWDDHSLYVGVEATDDVFHNEQPPDRVFLEDAIEIGLELDHRLTNDAKPWQYVAGTSAKGDVLMRCEPNPECVTNPDPHRLAIHRVGDKGGKIIYQVAIPWSELNHFKPAAGKQIGFGLIADDGDGKPNDRKFISWFGSGISSKKPSELGDLILVK